MPRKQTLVFVFFLSASIICNERGFSVSNPPESFDEVILFLGSLVFGCLLFNAHSRITLMAASVVGLGMLLVKSSLSNHETLYAGLLTTFLATYTLGAWRERRLRIDLAGFHETLATVIRIEFFAYYFWVAFQKLNPQFFDSDVSCATYQLWKVAKALPVLPFPGWSVAFSGHISWVIETTLPILLLIPRTRRFGVLLAIAFHTTLSVGFPAFQYLVMAYLALFIPEQAWSRAASRISQRANSLIPRVVSIGRKTWARTVLGLLLVVLAGEFFEMARTPGYIRFLRQQTYALGTLSIFSGILIFYIARLFREGAWQTCGLLPLLPGVSSVLYLLPAVIFLQGLQPHLGFKAVQSFAMFSNLDTGNGQSNHFLVPASWQVSGNLSKLVTIHSSNHPKVRSLGSQKNNRGTLLRIPRPFRMKAHRWLDSEASAPSIPWPELRPSYLELRRVVTRLSEAGVRGLQVEYSLDGKRYSEKMLSETQNSRMPDSSR